MCVCLVCAAVMSNIRSELTQIVEDPAWLPLFQQQLTKNYNYQSKQLPPSRLLLRMLTCLADIAFWTACYKLRKSLEDGDELQSEGKQHEMEEIIRVFMDTESPQVRYSLSFFFFSLFFFLLFSSSLTPRKKKKERCPQLQGQAALQAQHGSDREGGPEGHPAEHGRGGDASVERGEDVSGHCACSLPQGSSSRQQLSPRRVDDCAQAAHPRQG